MRSSAPLIVSALILLSACATSAPERSSRQCRATPVSLSLEPIAPAVGTSPVWMTGGSLGCWCGQRPLKTVWILDRRYAGTLSIRGVSTEGDVVVYFPGEVSNVETTFLVPNATEGSSAEPGGASAELLAKYAFHNGYVSYPSPGCFHLTATLGIKTVDIVVSQKRCHD